MPSYRSLALLAIFGAGVLADDATSINGSDNAQICPGVIHGSATCCVGGTLVLSVCDGWPICNGPTTTTQNSISCATLIPTTDTVALSSASASIKASGVQYETAIPKAGSNMEGGASATQTGSSSVSETAVSSGGTMSTTVLSTGSSASVQQTTSSSASSTGGVARVTFLSGAAGAAIVGLAALL